MGGQVTYLPKDKGWAEGLAEAVRAYVTGKRLNKEETRQRLRDIVSLGQVDPEIYKSPEAKSLFTKLGYPTPEPAKPMTLESVLNEDVTGPLTGYEKPTLRVGPTGGVTGMTLTPKKQAFPEGYKEDLSNAVSAITRGADPYKVYRRIAASYPGQSAELKRILLYTPATKRLEAIREALFGTE